MKIRIKCDYCQKQINRTPYQIKKKKHHFCDWNCFKKYLVKFGVRKGRNNPRYRGATICPKCGEHKFCTSKTCRSCYGKTIKVFCDNCGKEKMIPEYELNNLKHHFCNKKCYIEFLKKTGIRAGKNNVNYRDKVNGSKGIVKFVKDNKGKTLEEIYGKEKAKEIIKKTTRHLENHGRWLGGISFEPYGIEFNDELKLKIRERDNFQCQVCGIKENGKAHNVHHKDYDKQNNDDTNLISLCDSCHSRTNINREYWESYFNQVIEQNPQYELSL